VKLVADDVTLADRTQPLMEKYKKRFQ